jgi:hypothetical protein
MSLGRAMDAAMRVLLALPIEVRRPDFALVRRATLGNIRDLVADVAPGTYVISVGLPGGSRVGQEVVLKEDGTIDSTEVSRSLATLPTIASDIGRAMSSNSSANVLRAALSLAGSMLAKLPTPQIIGRSASSLASNTPPDTTPVKIICSDGAPLTARARLREADYTVRQARSGWRISRKLQGASSVIQLLQSTRPPINVVLPPATILKVKPPFQAGSRLRIGISVGNDVVDRILQLRRRGRIEEVVSLMPSLTPAAVNSYVKNKPGAALAAGYILLRSIQTEIARKVIAIVVDSLNRSPDALVMGAELAARAGDHSAALSGFVSARKLGLPAFSYGINYTIDRLRMYATSANEVNKLEQLKINGAEIRAAKEALSACQTFALFMDFANPMTMYTGRNIDDPDEDSLPATDFDMIEAQTIYLEPVAAVDGHGVQPL